MHYHIIRLGTDLLEYFSICWFFNKILCIYVNRFTISVSCLWQTLGLANYIVNIIQSLIAKWLEEEKKRWGKNAPKWGSINNRVPVPKIQTKVTMEELQLCCLCDSFHFATIAYRLTLIVAFTVNLCGKSREIWLLQIFEAH